MVLIKGEYLVRNTTNIRTDGIFYDLKLHVSAYIGHFQVSTILFIYTFFVYIFIFIFVFIFLSFIHAYEQLLH